MARLGENLREGILRLSGDGEYRESSLYYDEESFPPDAAYFDRLERLNDAFPEWLEPGDVAAPTDVEEESDSFFFPSPVPSGEAAVDRVELKVYPRPEGAPEVGILFHHWLGFEHWLPVDWLLAPLAERYRVAAMVAPHHRHRRIEDLRSGEGFVNPNPRHVFEGFRQWQGDHLASLALLARDHGFTDVVTVGYSLGAYSLLLHRLIRPPGPTVVISTTNSYARGVWEGDRADRLRERVEEAGFSRESFAQATRSLHLARWAAEIGGLDLTWIYGHYDDSEPTDSLDEAREALAPERVVELEGGHTTAILHRARIDEEVARRVEGLVA